MVPGIADKKNNSLPLWGNEKTMNLNNLILTNILSSHYFKINLYQLKTYHEVVDEIYYQVTHLEPWEKGSRKTSGQTGMCGGVRGVGAGGIVSTAFCILYKLFTLKLTRKQLVGLINHTDSAYIRGLGFMYIRYTQPPSDLWSWYSPYLEDEEEIDVKAGGGQIMTVGDMLRHFLSKLEWFSTLFPRIPVPIQKDLESKLSEFSKTHKGKFIRSPPDSEEVPASGDTADACIGNHFEDEESSARSSHEDYKTKEFDVDVKENKKEKDSKDEDRDSPDYSRERQKRDKHGSTSKHYHSPERHKSHSSRARSRSPHDSKRHRSRHRESDKSDYHRNRDHSSYHKDSEPADYDKLYKDKRHERRDERSHSHGYEKRHNHSRNKY